MKKQLLTSLFSLAGLSVFAQPTIQASGFYPTIGESFDLHTSDYVAPGPNGSNVTWDLSGLSPNTDQTVNVLTPNPSISGTTHNIEYVGQSNIYCNLSTNDYLIHAESTAQGLIEYSDYKKLYQFPMTMGTSFSDNFVSSIVIQGDVASMTGSVNAQVDGYGTLITPTGTFTNVLRVHSIHSNVTTFQGNTTNGTIDMYTWIKAGIHIELATVQTITTPFGTQQTALYADGANLGLTHNESVNSLVLFPNPAQDVVSFIYDLKIDKIEVVDLNGRTIATPFDQANKTIDVSGLQSGVYYVNVYSNNNKSIQKFLKN